LPIVADTLTDAQRATLGVIAETPPEPPPTTRREREQKRDAMVQASGHLSFKGEKCLPCPYCARVFVASAFRRLQIDGGYVLVCRGCKDKAMR
jgi:hypothetical protein